MARSVEKFLPLLCLLLGLASLGMVGYVEAETLPACSVTGSSLAVSPKDPAS